MKKILVATDGSVHADKALDVAAALAKKYGSQVSVIHVLMREAPFSAIHRAFAAQGLSTRVLDELAETLVLPVAYGAGTVAPVVPLIHLVELGQRILDRAKAALEAEGIQTASFKMEDGHPPKVILDVAKRENVDAIVIGHRGLSVFGEMMMGSVSTRVAHLASCTVITVK